MQSIIKMNHPVKCKIGKFRERNRMWLICAVLNEVKFSEQAFYSILLLPWNPRRTFSKLRRRRDEKGASCVKLTRFCTDQPSFTFFISDDHQKSESHTQRKIGLMIRHQGVRIIYKTILLKQPLNNGFLQRPGTSWHSTSIQSDSEVAVGYANRRNLFDPRQKCIWRQIPILSQVVGSIQSPIALWKRSGLILI